MRVRASQNAGDSQVVRETVRAPSGSKSRTRLVAKPRSFEPVEKILIEDVALFESVKAELKAIRGNR